MKQSNLNIIQLNEINFDILKMYINRGLSIPTLERIYKSSHKTQSEKEYKLLEPWIQWPSFYTGKSYSEHEIFNLGDYMRYEGDDLVSEWVKAGLDIVAISPMNLSNRSDKNDVFIPDPWMHEKSSGGFVVAKLAEAISEFVNNNSSGKVSLLSKIKLLYGVINILNINQVKFLMDYYRKINGLSYRKAIFLDYILTFVYLNSIEKKKNYRGLLFLNAGAHIQHHYFFNSKVIGTKKLLNPSWYINPTLDPLEEVLLAYDYMLGEILESSENSLIVTGLSQEPYNQVKYYYRLRDHAAFLNKHGVRYSKVFPRMTRDFEVTFENERQKLEAMQFFESFKDKSGTRVFGHIQDQESSLFITSNYPKEIDNAEFYLDETKVNLSDDFVFVAIKNGSHCSVGYWAGIGQDLNSDDWEINNIWDFYKYLT